MHNAEGANRLIAPCVTACPAQVDVPRYIGYTERGQFAEADAVVRESIPLPTVCGLICYRPCEPWCRRGIMESPVAINAIKRAAAEHGASDLWQRRWPQTVGAPTGKRVAIVGSGPTGLTAAYYLAKRKGHSVTIFEAMPELGGQLRIGLPEYKVPRDQLQREIELITQTRVEVKTGVWVDSLEELTREFDATLLAIGHTRPRPLDIEGEGLPGVGWACDFLRDVNLGRRQEAGRRVIILGGNNIALDSARCAVRLGAEEVTVVISGTRAGAGASDAEFSGAEEEGVRFTDLVAPRGIGLTGRSLTVELVRLQVTETDAWGRGTVAPMPGSAFAVEADTVLVSVGQEALVPRGWGLGLTPQGTIKANGRTLVTEREGVFAGGDAVSGPDSIVEAMAQGKRAAVGIDQYLGGDGDITESLAPEPGEEMEMPQHIAQQGKPVVPMPTLDPGERKYTFAMVEQGYSKAEAAAEARRCIRCDLWRQGSPEVWSAQHG